MRNGFKNDTCAVAILNIGGGQEMAFGASDHPGAGFGVLIRDGNRVVCALAGSDLSEKWHYVMYFSYLQP
ncbi:hypothetical protein [Rhizobium leguminosarum]|uniref:hypothetical protein n=1 Tax=Rhizobium leguminosarum TaxID=384 RepID=UPI0012BC5BBB|nr:hypothetical protein [Rhizobium leguminosarum]MBY5738927.1 hypothetical protein [Rhizobium leguminosarum]